MDHERCCFCLKHCTRNIDVDWNQRGVKNILSVRICSECEYFFYFQSESECTTADNKEDALDDMGCFIIENRIKENYCWYCEHPETEWSTFSWENGEEEKTIDVRVCKDCIIKLPPKHDFIVQGDSYSEALTYIKNSKEF